MGVEFRGDAEALRLLREAGASVDGERVRFPRGMCRSIVQATAPRQFTQYARNPARNVEIGGMHTVFAPNYGSPFVRDLDGGRRYGTIEDFRNLVKLTYVSPYLHHSGGTVCEPVDVPVNKRHLDMVYSHIRYSDKPFMGSVTAPQRAQDSVELARIAFGADYLEDHPVMLSLINANSPLVWDSVMLGAARAYAEANQATLLTPFILAGAMAPVTAAGVCAQTLAEALAGMTFVQLTRPGAPVVLGSFASSMSMQSGAPTFGTPEPALVLYVMAALARRLGVPFRSGGSLCASKVADAQAAYESAATLQPTVLAGVNFVLHAAGWLEGGLTVGYEKFIMDADQCGMMAVFTEGVDLSENGQALDAIRHERAGDALPGLRPHAGQLRERVLPQRDRRQQQLRAVARGRLARRRPAGQRASGRSSSPSTRRRRSTRPSTRPCWTSSRDEGVHAGLRGLAPCCSAVASLSDAGACGGARAASMRAPTFELVPLKNALDQAGFPAARRDGLGDGIAGQGDRGDRRLVRAAASPRLSGSPAPVGADDPGPRPLSELIAWLEGAGVDRAFVVGGDAKEPGDYPDGLSLLRAMAEIGHPLAEIGIPAYPQGHAFIADAPAPRGASRQGGLRQLHDHAALLRPGGDRSRGWPPDAPRASPFRSTSACPGVAEPQRLLAISARIGVADTHRFLIKNTRFIARLIRSGGFYRPDGLLEGLAPHIADPASGIVDLHLYTFNAVDVTEKLAAGLPRSAGGLAAA